MKKHAPHIQAPEGNHRGQTSIHQDTKTMALVQFYYLKYKGIPGTSVFLAQEEKLLPDWIWIDGPNCKFELCEKKGNIYYYEKMIQKVAKILFEYLSKLQNK